MSKPFNIDVKEKTKNKSSHYELYKELERINLKQLENTSNNERKKLKRGARISLFTQFQNLINIKELQRAKLLKENFKTQYAAFQGATRVLIIVGQCFGLNPFSGVLDKDPSKIRFQGISIRHLYSVILCSVQFIATMLSLISFTNKSVTVESLAYPTFYCTTCITSVLFLILARRWQLLNKKVSLSRLDEYIDPYIHLKCITAVVVILSLALFEHILSIISNITFIMDCNDDIDSNIFKLYVEEHFPWMFEMSVTFSLPLGIFLVFINLVCTMNWNYSHVFIVCISIYLTSILEQINKKLISAEGQCLPSSFWKALREDYNSATRLVRIFDDYVNGIILVAFASNLFFVCLQLFYVLAHGLKYNKNMRKECTGSYGPFNGYEHALYFYFSLAFVLSRALAVSLITSRVHSASLVAAPALYTVPSEAYCIEVQRFIEQAHGDTVALTGMNFFYITRELVLSVAGTIITYELVLLQFNVESPSTVSDVTD